jgi:hypothetical protein
MKQTNKQTNNEKRWACLQLTYTLYTHATDDAVEYDNGGDVQQNALTTTLRLQLPQREAAR